MTFVVADKPLGAPNLRRLSSLSALLPLLADCTVEPIGGDLRILVSGGEPPMSDELLQRIERLWHEERREHPNRFDGTLLSFAGRSVEGVLGRFVPYRFYLAKRRDAALPLKITPLAVTGALLCDGRIAFARRAEGTTQYPGRLELVPSGGIDADTLRADGSIDHRAQLIRELTEETGIPASAIIRFETIALLHDRVDDVIDVASLIEVEASAGAVAEATLRDGTAEYRSLRWVPLTDLGAFLEQHHAELIPSSRALGDLLARRG
jgi:8-oxo-dGTP pyrophosphatase MutT (NUDIX family)